MKRQLATPLVSLLICLMLLPLASLVDASGSDGGSLAAITSNGSALAETFDNVATGTTGNFNDFILMPNHNTDTVVLDGRLWIMFRGNDSALVAKYSPPVAQNTWNVSFDAFTPRNGASYRVQNLTPGTYGLRTMLVDGSGQNITGIELLVGPSNLEGILVYDRPSRSWSRESEGIMQALANRTAYSESSPDRYSVSFARTSSNALQLTVIHSAAGVVFVKNLDVDNDPNSVPSLHFYSDANVGFITTTDIHGPYPVSGGWMLDNFESRPLGVGFAEVQPNTEQNNRSDPLWVKVVDQYGKADPNAVVAIAGRQAMFNPSNGRYEADSGSPAVGWAVPTSYSVMVGGVAIDGLVKVTTTPDPCAAVVTKWWNGWGWATVLGRDDCSGPATVLDMFKGYDHPLTAYIFTDNPQGNSSMILPTQSEIAKHGPHDYYNWMKKTWKESEESAKQGQQALRTAYTFASRWDDPSYVGNGDTYISMANPGNTATFQMEYAQYAAGVRIEGISSNQANGAPGNDSLISAWGVDQWSKWDPTTPIDLMDALRQVNTDNAQDYGFIMSIAQRGGLARIYNHGTIRQPDLLHWVCNEKTDGTPENWKATDGEAASYYFGRMTTDVRSVPSESTSETQVYEVSRQDPKVAGYWLVPVTVAVPLGNSTVESVEVIGTDGTLSSLPSSDSVLRNLSGARVMDVGYDIRDGVLYVSSFWNETSELRVHFVPKDPSIMNHPRLAMPIGSTYSYNATSTNGTGDIIWTLNTDAPFLSIQWSDRTHCLVSGTPTQPGTYSVSITVSSAVHSSSANYSLIVWEPPDNEPPVTTLSGDIGHWVNRSAIVRFSALDAVSGVMSINYAIDDGPWKEWTRTTSIGSEGRHTIRYYSVDNAGNSESVRQDVLLIDRKAPEARFDNPQKQQFFDGKLRLRFNSWDNLSGIASVRILGESGDVYGVRPGESSLVLDGVAAGNRTYVLEVVDNAGNTMTTTLTVDVRSGGGMAWDENFLLSALTLSLVAGLLCTTAVILGGRKKGKP